jgi:hypothetical protein
LYLLNAISILFSLDETSPDMRRKLVTKFERRRVEKGTRLVGDMVFAVEELLFGDQRFFHHPRPSGYYYTVCHIATAFSNQIPTYSVQLDSS